MKNFQNYIKPQLQNKCKIYKTISNIYLAKTKSNKNIKGRQRKKHVHRATLKLTLAFSLDKKAEGNEMSRQRWETK